ncbi:Trimethyllysine dioxygenase [Penicillium cataractarum]|uniref:Trimethyllysine dioxygenase n=1 Tax=Penicillium cataractarum TaxID=2100454 RepID=A0A9W9RUW8_9EURO|nr:Trimethyllysine dioxygenase [Penicillium cataractarum]KAJ5364303.1 Trimethyllysine dioxygenase [Penicillium cataractarum]
MAQIIAEDRLRLTYLVRPQITPLHVFKSGTLAIGSRNVAPLARSTSSPYNVSRLLSDATQPESTTQDINATNDAFEAKNAQLAYNAALRNGNVVFRTDGKNEAAPFWQFSQWISISQFPDTLGPSERIASVPSAFIRTQGNELSTPSRSHPVSKPKKSRERTAMTSTSNVRARPSTMLLISNTHTAPGSDGHESTYSWKWLSTHRGNNKPPIQSRTVQPNRLPRSFKAYDPQKGDPYPEVVYEEVMSKDTAVLEWLENIWTWGFCFVKGVPVNPESTKTLIERISFIRHTHYGGFWDFTADLTYKDTAYTNEWLGAHTDNTYFTDPARLQLFHLLSHTDGDGGKSLLVDGFAAARTLAKENPGFYNTLTNSRHPWHASGNEDVCIQPSAMAPVLNVHPDTKAVYQVRWNNYDRAPKTNWHTSEQREWYMAARAYNDLLTKSSNEIWTQLQPGTALIFDNWRMLHGRSEFTGKRRMCGGYVNNDDFVSRLRLLKFGRQSVLDNLGNTGGWRNRNNPYSIY